jgi:nitroreductase
MKAMENPATVDHPVHDLIRKRWSPRAFSNQSVPERVLSSLFEAARWAPSCFNEQPWDFIIANKDDSDAFSKMLGCLTERNQAWAKEAGVLIIAVAKIDFDHNGAPNRHAHYDTGQAVAGLTVQATALGIQLHQMAGFSPDQARKIYAIPQGHEPLTAIALGYPGDPEALPDQLRKMELADRKRKSVSQFVFSGRWKEAES